MNTYIISMLVIFYLQMNHGLPIVTELASTIAAKTKFVSENKLDEFVKEFYEFYGRKFEPKTHLISINVGKWQQKIQKRFVFLVLYYELIIIIIIIYILLSSTQVGIIACPNNWENCMMWVQDAISLSNITAEITKNEIDNFVRMCKFFAEYSDCSTIARNLEPSMLNSIQVTELIRLIERDVSDSIVTSLLKTRKRFELEIISTLEKYVYEFDPSLKLYPFGSSQYRVGATNTNFNILITTSKI